jgi:hypothetical protein
MTNTLNYTDNDRLLATHLCGKNDAASKFIQDPNNQYFKDFLFHANRLKHKTNDSLTDRFTSYYKIQPYEYKPGKSYSIKESLPSSIDEKPSGFHDAYVWIIKQVYKASCSFKGKNGASLKTYLNSVLNHDWTYNHWEMHIYGDKRHIPVDLKNMSSDEIEIFKKYRKYLQFGEEIAFEKLVSELNIDSVKVEDILNKIKKVLLEKNKLHLLINTYYAPYEEKEMVLKDSEAKVRKKEGVEYCLAVFQKEIGSLNSFEKDLLRLKYQQRKNIREIMNFFHSNNRRDELNRHKIKRSKDLYKLIDSILERIIIEIQKKLKMPLANKKTAVIQMYEILERSLA